jgi:hypothetical protein
MTRFLLALPLLAACTHTPCDAVWPRTCEERDGGQMVRASIGEPERPVDASPPAAEPDDKPDHNGGKSNGGSSDSNDGNGGDSE